MISIFVLGQQDMKLNNALPGIEVDPQTNEVRADSELLTCKPARVISTTQVIFCFDYLCFELCLFN